MPHLIVCRSLFSLSALLLLLLAGCAERAQPPDAEQAAKPLVVGVSLCKTDGAWRAQMKTDIEDAAQRANLQIEIVDAENDATKQQAQLEEFLARQAKLVVVSPKDAQAITEPVARLFDAGIPVIVLDRAVIGDKYTCLIAADPKQIGAEAGEWLAQRLQGKGRIVEIRGPVDSLPAEDLHTSFRAKLLDPGYYFVFDGHVDLPRVDGGKLMGEALGRVEQIDVVFAYDDAAAYAAYQAAKAARREKGVLFVGVGGTTAEGAAYVSQGALDATLLAPTGGAEAVDAAVKLLDGKQVPKKIVPATRVLSRESPLPPGEG